jgi:hypothetical protein
MNLDIEKFLALYRKICLAIVSFEFSQKFYKFYIFMIFTNAENMILIYNSLITASVRYRKIEILYLIIQLSESPR